MATAVGFVAASGGPSSAARLAGGFRPLNHGAARVLPPSGIVDADLQEPGGGVVAPHLAGAHVAIGAPSAA